MSEDRKPVFEDHIGLIKSIVCSFDRTCRPEDSELFAVACMGLMRAISTFDRDKSKFSYWATKIIRNGIIAEIRKRKGVAVAISSLEPDERDRALARRNAEMPLEIVSFLTDPCDTDTPSERENKRILRRHYIDEVPMAEIAREVGFTRENIRQKVNKAIRSIRNKHARLLDDHFVWLSGRLGSAEV